jgi:hypothetical protein
VEQSLTWTEAAFHSCTRSVNDGTCSYLEHQFVSASGRVVFFDLGTYSRGTSTASTSARRWFDGGLVWPYAFHHEEAIRCFERALEHDPG